MEIRASDDDRQRTVAALERHTGAGRLTLDEFAERARAAHSARTLEDLAAVVHDLPAEPTAGAVAVRVDDDAGRGLFLLFAIAAATLVLLGVFIALRG